MDRTRNKGHENNGLVSVKKTKNQYKNHENNLALSILHSAKRIQIPQEVIQPWKENELQKLAKTRGAYRQFAGNWEKIKDLNTRELKEGIALGGRTGIIYALL